MTACLGYSDEENFLRSRAPYSATNGDRMHYSVYRNGTHFKELVTVSKLHVSYLPACFNHDRKNLPLKLVKSGNKLVVVANKTVGRSQYLHWPVIQQTLSPDHTGTYFCCDNSPTTSGQCSSAGQATYRLQVVGKYRKCRTNRKTMI